MGRCKENRIASIVVITGWVLAVLGTVSGVVVGISTLGWGNYSQFFFLWPTFIIYTGVSFLTLLVCYAVAEIIILLQIIANATQKDSY